MPKQFALCVVVLFGLGGCIDPQPSDVHFRGAVAAATPEATAAGLRILDAGGNAIDASVAIAFALAVTESCGSGLGGQIVLLVSPPGEEPYVINGSSHAPSLVQSNLPRASIVAHKASTVPTFVRTLAFSIQEYGSGKVSWADALTPAIKCAREGYAIGSYQFRVLVRYKADLQRHPVTCGLLDQDGEVPRLGSLFRQPRLASTLDRLAQCGEGEFYSGEIASQIVHDMQTNGGWITADDLARCPRPTVVAPLHHRYRDHDIYTLPPPFGGWVVLQALRLLEEVPQEELHVRSRSRPMHLARALRLAHGDRLRNPIGSPPDCDRAVHNRLQNGTLEEVLESSRDGGGETTHFTVVDANGMVVSATSSINSFFGARVGHPELGFLYNDYMREFAYDVPGHPFELQPNARPYSSMAATIVSHDGAPQLALGSPGSKRIISAVVQVLTGWLDGARDLEQAIAFSRLHTPSDRELLVEDMGLVRDKLVPFESRGFRVLQPRSSLAVGSLNPYFGGVHGVAWERDHWIAAADPRRDGMGIALYGDRVIEGRAESTKYSGGQ